MGEGEQGKECGNEQKESRRAGIWGLWLEAVTPGVGPVEGALDVALKDCSAERRFTGETPRRASASSGAMREAIRPSGKMRRRLTPFCFVPAASFCGQ